MTTLIDFTSLFQLAFGTGIALSLFQAPVRLRLDPLLARIANELILLSGSSDPKARDRLLALQSLQIDAAVARAQLEAEQRRPLVVSLAGAAVNLLLLVWASLDADQTISVLGEVGFVLLTVGWFVGTLSWMEFLALNRMGPIIAEYNRR